MSFTLSKDEKTLSEKPISEISKLLDKAPLSIKKFTMPMNYYKLNSKMSLNRRQELICLQTNRCMANNKETVENEEEVIKTKLNIKSAIISNDNEEISKQIEKGVITKEQKGDINFEAKEKAGEKEVNNNSLKETNNIPPVINDNSIIAKNIPIITKPIMVKETNDLQAKETNNNTPIIINDSSVIANNTPIIANDSSVITNNTPIIANDSSVITNNTPIIANDSSVIANNTLVVTEDAPIKEPKYKQIFTIFSNIVNKITIVLLYIKTIYRQIVSKITWSKSVVEPEKESLIKELEVVEKKEIIPAEESLIKECEVVEKKEIKPVEESLMKELEVVEKKEIKTESKSLIKELEVVEKKEIKTESKSLIKEVQLIRKENNETLVVRIDDDSGYEAGDETNEENQNINANTDNDFSDANTEWPYKKPSESAQKKVKDLIALFERIGSK